RRVGQSLAYCAGEEERRRAMENVLAARPFAHSQHFGERDRPIARWASGADARNQLLIRGDDGGSGAAAGRGDVRRVEVRCAWRLALGGRPRGDAGWIEDARFEFPLRHRRKEALYFFSREAEASAKPIHQKVAYRQHVEPARLVILAEDAANLV